MASSLESSTRKYPVKNSRALGQWRRLELVFAYVYAGAFVLTVVYKSIILSADFASGSKAGWLWGLKEGWIFNQRVDLSDSQWRNFRGNIPALTAVMALFTLMGQVFRSSFGWRKKGMSWFWLLTSFAYIYYLHGTSFLIIGAIALGNFLVVKLLGGSFLLPACLWTYNIVFLVCNRVYGGYKFASFGEQWAFMDNNRGIMRWHISFNLVMLRMVSFGLDYYWACISRRSTFDWEVCPLFVPQLSAKRSIPKDAESVNWAIPVIFHDRNRK